MTGNLFLDCARHGNNSIWRYLVTLVLIVGLVMVASVALAISGVLIEGSVDLQSWSSWLLLVISMAPFIFIWLGLWIGLKFLHRRPFATLINPGQQFRWRYFLFSFGLWLILAILSDIVMSLMMPGNYQWTLDLRQLLPYSLLAMILVPIQTTAEELLFRGYLTQAFGLLGKRLWLPLLVPSGLFGLLHGMNPEVGAYGPGFMMAYYIGMGLLLGWITLRSQGLEMAFGLHWVNNLYGTIAVTYPEAAIRSPAMFTMHKLDPALGLILFFGMAVIYLFVTSWLLKSQASERVALKAE